MSAFFTTSSQQIVCTTFRHSNNPPRFSNRTKHYPSLHSHFSTKLINKWSYEFNHVVWWRVVINVW